MVVAVLALVSPVYAAEKIGKVVAVVGSPQAKGETGTRRLSSGSDVFENDSIVVSTGNAQIQLRDGTRLVVGPGSQLRLDNFVMRGKSKAEVVSIKALRGTFRFITGKSGKSAYKIATSSATIGIRGTGFDFWVKKKTGAVVLRGAIVLKGLNGGSVNVKSAAKWVKQQLRLHAPSWVSKRFGSSKKICRFCQINPRWCAGSGLTRRHVVCSNLIRKAAAKHPNHRKSKRAAIREMTALS